MARNVVRTTISIASELKARMDAIGEPVNWSAVASRAFEQEIADIIKKRGTKNMQDVISRLRASKAAAEGEAVRTGRVSGEAWAKDRATAAQLEGLEAFRDQCLEAGLTLSDWFASEMWRGWTHAGVLGSVLIGYRDTKDCEADEAADVASETAGELFGSDAEDLSWLRGFVEGALDVWEQVKDKV